MKKSMKKSMKKPHRKISRQKRRTQKHGGKQVDTKERAASLAARIDKVREEYNKKMKIVQSGGDEIINTNDMDTIEFWLRTTRKLMNLSTIVSLTIKSPTLANKGFIMVGKSLNLWDALDKLSIKEKRELVEPYIIKMQELTLTMVKLIIANLLRAISEQTEGEEEEEEEQEEEEEEEEEQTEGAEVAKGAEEEE